MARRLGQHFLHDPAILDRIVEALDPQPADFVLEVGPGPGTLTSRLAPRVGRVVAIEMDRDLAEGLRADLASAGHHRGVEVVTGDALALDWHALTPPAHDGPRKIVGNVPYYITSPLIEKALQPPAPAVVVFLVQREVADRVAAPPGSRTYGALSVGVQAVARAERLFTVRAGAFRPPPRVDSALLRLTPLERPAVPETERAGFRAFVVAIFGQRRKQIARGLRILHDLDAARSVAVCEAAGVAPDARPEALDVAAFVRLFHAMR